jgi:cytochrome c peroxidase
MRQSILIATILSSLFSGLSLAADPTALLDNFATQARQQDPNFAGFSGERGKALYWREELRDDKTMSCTTCHGEDPMKAGRTLTFRKIDPLAPSAAPARFTDVKKVEKWFRRNCNDVFGRECSAQEKGDFISWISNLK